MPDHYTRYMRFPSLNRLDALMTRLLPTFRALLDALDSIGLARKPTTQQTHALCQRFVEMVAGITGERCAIAIGQTVIAREHGHRTNPSRSVGRQA